MTTAKSEPTAPSLPLWAALALSTLSGALMALAMPTLFDVGWLGWIGLVPLLVAMLLIPHSTYWWLTLPAGLIWSLAAHIWYPDFFGIALGGFLVIAVGAYYGGILQVSFALVRRLPGMLAVLAVPVVWSALQFIKYIAPVVRDWWFVLLTNTQWRFPAALQVLSLTGFPGLELVVMLANMALALLIVTAWRERSLYIPGVVALGVVIAVVAWGAWIIPPVPGDAFSVAATVDLANQDPAIRALSDEWSESEGPYADTDAQSQALFDINAGLTRDAGMPGEVAFVVWPENEFANADNPAFSDQVAALSDEVGAYIVADMTWGSDLGLHDTAVLFDPGGEIGRRAKINTTGGEEEYGIVPGPAEYPVFSTEYGPVGIGVCWDRHTLTVVQELARSGAQIVLMPADDDFLGNTAFPPLHAADSVFRAVEHRVAFAAGSTSGVAIVVDPYGRITAISGMNERQVISGQTFTVDQTTLYTRWGDWFGWLLVAASVVGFVVPVKRVM